MAYTFQEFPKSLYKNGVPAATAKDREEQEALLEEGFDLPPSNEAPPTPCEGCKTRDAKIVDLEAQLAALVTKRGAKPIAQQTTEELLAKALELGLEVEGLSRPELVSAVATALKAKE
jgi:hypothetical protein